MGMTELDGAAERAAADVVYQGAYDSCEGWILDAIAEGRPDHLTQIRVGAVLLMGLRALQLEIRAMHADNREETL
jgi:hypothetical protein